ncbi:MAG: alkaline phosphatase family protein [Thermoplasmatales archaeon]|nr:alkaline phosphatase family protein [Thermoplasmatales archaeon]
MSQRNTRARSSGAILANGRITIRVLVIIVAILMILEFNPNVIGAQSNTKTPIKHLIILMMENHSFDNIFGQYGRTSLGNIASNVTIPLNLISRPFSQKLYPVSSGNFSTADPYEGYYNYHRDWNNGSMNGFPEGSGPNSLYYFTANQMGLEWAISQNYAMGDMYFSSTLSETLPNRLLSLAGYSPVTQDQPSPPPYIPYNQTIFSELDTYGVSWAYYTRNPSEYTVPLNFISGINQMQSKLRSWQDFEDSLLNGTLPSVSWVSPIGGGARYFSQHPPDNILIGEIWLFNIIEMVMKSDLWNSSAIFVTYDEGGGYYDQVSPPTLGGTQLGFRVPFIVISPYAKEDYVSHTIMSHTSILGFIDYNWKMLPLNSLVAKSSIPLDVFNFNSVYQDGHIIRGPYRFNPSFQKFLTNGLDFNVSIAERFHDIGYLFPSNFQYSPSSLEYPLQGESHFNLSQVTNSTYEHRGKSLQFGTDSIMFFSAIGVVVTGTLLYTYFRRHNHGRRR